MQKFTTVILTRDKKVQSDMIDYLDLGMLRKEQCGGRTEYPLDCSFDESTRQLIRIEGDIVGLTAGVPVNIKEAIKSIVYDE